MRRQHRKKGPSSLSASRPPTARQNPSISRKATRTLINKHHVLEKQRLKALREGRQEEADAAAVEISAIGGLQSYQHASLLGQSKARGGDSSKVLLGWLQPLTQKNRQAPGTGPRIKMLEVGALSTRNACSISDHFEVERIDLQSQERDILQQDFMQRPLPSTEDQRFDIISLSLVLNFVPNAADRGAMLLRTIEFLRDPLDDMPRLSPTLVPSVFVVLPRSCIANSRYFTETKFAELMTYMGFRKTRSKATQKLAFYLWTRDTSIQPSGKVFTKEEINPGRFRNNFAIILEQVPSKSTQLSEQGTGYSRH